MLYTAVHIFKKNIINSISEILLNIFIVYTKICSSMRYKREIFKVCTEGKEELTNSPTCPALDHRVTTWLPGIVVSHNFSACQLGKLSIERKNNDLRNFLEKCQINL